MTLFTAASMRGFQYTKLREIQPELCSGRQPNS